MHSIFSEQTSLLCCSFYTKTSGKYFPVQTSHSVNKNSLFKVNTQGEGDLNSANEVFFYTSQGVNGGFTDWSQPGPCSKSCGKGVRFQERTCTNPKPSFNGRDCQGETKRVVPYWCNSQVSIYELFAHTAE